MNALLAVVYWLSLVAVIYPYLGYPLTLWLATRVRGTRLLTGLVQMDCLRALVGAVGDDIEKDQCSLLKGVAHQPFAHPFEPPQKKRKG